jgi:hypothetical protein
MVGYGDGPDFVDMGGVRFARARIVSRDWAALGFTTDPIAAIKDPAGLDIDDCDVVAIVVLPDAEENLEAAAAQRADTALRNLLACNPAWGRNGKRRPLAPGISTIKLLGFHHAQKLKDEASASTTWNFAAPLHEIRLDGFWWENSTSGFYRELNALLGRTRNPWEERLVDVSGLLGAGRLAVTPWESFFCSMIGIERLLKKPKETWKKGIPPALRTLFGWLSSSRGLWYAQELEKLYQLRNQLVHEGRIREVEQNHAALADEVLYNCLSLGLKHVNEVTSLDELLKAAELLSTQKAQSLPLTALVNAIVVHPL